MKEKVSSSIMPSEYPSRKRLFFLHLIPLFLMASLFFIPETASLWWAFDHASFRFLNTSIAGHPIQEVFWSLANIKITDLYGAFFYLSSFLLYVYEAKTKEERRLRLGYMIYTIIWFEISILFTKQLLTPICEYIKISRHSPTVMLPDVIRLSIFCPWAKIKDVSHFCFPSDHAVIVFQWCFFFTYFAGFSRGIFVSLFSTVFLLPRLISGAHWMSDILVGSMSIVIIAFSFATQSRLYDICMNWIQTKLTRVSNWRDLEKKQQEHLPE